MFSRLSTRKGNNSVKNVDEVSVLILCSLSDDVLYYVQVL